MARRKFVVGAIVLADVVGLYVFLSYLGYVTPIWTLPSVLCFDGCPDAKPMHRPPAGAGLLNNDAPLTRLLETESLDKDKISILIEKAKYRLTVYEDLNPIKSYPMVLGSAPTGDKLQEGDRKTPEGIFRIRDLYPHESWSKFLWLDYPTEDSWRKHREAKRSGKLAPTATIGGEIGIHGVPEGSDGLIADRQNWTLGCPSLTNQDIDEIYNVVQVGTVVEIVP